MANWISVADSLPRKEGEFIVFYKTYDGAFITGILPFIPGIVGDVVGQDEVEFERMLDAENCFYKSVNGCDGEWWFEPVEVSHWMPLPIAPEYDIDIVDGVFKGDFIKRWVNAHRFYQTPYTEIAKKLWNTIWSKEAQAAGVFPLNRKLDYKVLSVKNGQRVFTKKVATTA